MVKAGHYIKAARAVGQPTLADPDSAHIARVPNPPIRGAWVKAKRGVREAVGTCTVLAPGKGSFRHLRNHREDQLYHPVPTPPSGGGIAGPAYLVEQVRRDSYLTRQSPGQTMPALMPHEEALRLLGGAVLAILMRDHDAALGGRTGEGHSNACPVSCSFFPTVRGVVTTLPVGTCSIWTPG